MSDIRYGTRAAAPAQAQAGVLASSVFLSKVFTRMGVGLGITGVVAWLTVASGLVAPLFNSGAIWIFLLAELGLVFYLSARIERLQASTAATLFTVYAAMNGLTLSGILLAYTGASVASTFFVCAGMFAAVGTYGMVTKRDLSGVGSFMFMGLVGIILATIVNFFLHSDALYWAISVIGVLVFVGLTAYDVQKIKYMGEAGIMQAGEEAISKGATIGALALYLDFINLFLFLLRFLGVSRD